MSTENTYALPDVTYRLDKMGDEIGQFEHLAIAWGEAAYQHLSAGGDSQTATRMLRHDDTGEVDVWQVGRHCDTTTHAVIRGWTLPADGWCHAITINNRRQFMDTYVTLAACLVENLLEDELSGLDVAVRVDEKIIIGIVTAVEDGSALRFVDGERVDLAETFEIHATHGGL